MSLISGEITTFYDILGMEDGETRITIYIDETEDEKRSVVVPKKNIAYIATATRKTKYSDFAARITGGEEWRHRATKRSIGRCPKTETEVTTE